MDDSPVSLVLSLHQEEICALASQSLSLPCLQPSLLRAYLQFRSARYQHWDRFFRRLAEFWSAAKDDTFQSQEQLNLPGLKNKVTVIRDIYGIPHIFAQNDEDAAFAVGYLQAKERLAQMDLQRRNAAGTMAALVGSDALQDDEFMRDVGLQRVAQASLDQMKPDDPSLLAMQAFANGVNAYINSIEPNNLPLEYKLLGVKQVQPWTVLDEMTFDKYMGWDLIHSFDDLYFTTLVEKMGLQKVYDLFPVNRPIETPFIPSWPADETPLTSVPASPQLDLAITSNSEPRRTGQSIKPTECVARLEQLGDQWISQRNGQTDPRLRSASWISIAITLVHRSNRDSHSKRRRSYAGWNSFCDHRAYAEYCMGSHQHSSRRDGLLHRKDQSR